MTGFRDNGTRRVLVKAGILIAAIAILDWGVDLNISFGFLYLFPMLLLGRIFVPWQLAVTAVFCTVLADVFDPFAPLVALPEDLLVLSALLGTGLFSYQMTKSRREQAENLQRVENESSARREAEEQLEFLVDSSPAAILTMNTSGQILLANPAAHRLFRASAEALRGENIEKYIPALGHITFNEGKLQKFRTEMQCRGQRASGDIFLANVFFSTYRTGTGPRLAALIVDASEELREREESSLQQMLAGSRILAGAVSHEIRNVCAAIAVIHENLVRSGTIQGNKDFDALGSLVEGLSKIAALELRRSTKTLEAGVLDVREVLDDLRIVLDSYCEDAGITLRWDIPERLPLVWADRHSLLQVLLNLTKNSERVLARSALKEIAFTVSVSTEKVYVRVTDTGPGVQSLDKLFQPFQKGADSTGLGLYLSRAFMRSFRGDLRHDSQSAGCSFVVELARADAFEEIPAPADENATNTTLVAG